MLLFTFGDADDLRKKIIALLSLSGDARRAIGQLLRGIVEKDHNIQRLAANLSEIFNQA